MNDDRGRSPEDDEPRIWALSRRELMPLAATVAGGALLGAPAAAARAVEVKRSPRKAGAIELCESPSPNPAFLARYLNDGGVLVWTVRPGAQTTAYRLNRAARIVWELANGTRSPQAIAKEYAQASKRPASEASTLLTELIKMAVLAQGGHVVPDGDFPPADKGVFRSRVSGVRMNRG